MWRFVHLTDLHLASQRDGVWNNRVICSMMPELMPVLAADLRTVGADFILATGDLCSRQDRAAVFETHAAMESLGMPYYPMGGNHDFVSEEARAWFLEAFAARLPEPRTYYSFTHKNLHCCVLDPWWRWADGTISPECEPSVAAAMEESLDRARWAIPPNQLAWLEEDLANYRGHPTIIATHYPALRIPDRLRRPGIQDSGALENGPLLLEMLCDFPDVRAIFSGHMHMHCVARAGGVTQVITGAMPEYPAEYRVVNVYDDRLELHTLGLSDGRFAARSLIPGKEWTAGEEQDRTAVIAF